MKIRCARVLVNGEDILEIVTPEKKLGHQDIGSLYFDLSEPFERDGSWHKWDRDMGCCFLCGTVGCDGIYVNQRLENGVIFWRARSRKNSGEYLFRFDEAQYRKEIEKLSGWVPEKLKKKAKEYWEQEQASIESEENP